MKNYFKAGLVLIAATSFAACNGDGNKAITDSTSVDSSTSVKTTIDTVAHTDSSQMDTTVKADTSAMGSSTTTDTASKTVTKKTVVKKSTTKQQ